MKKMLELLHLLVCLQTHYREIEEESVEKSQKSINQLDLNQEPGDS